MPNPLIFPCPNKRDCDGKDFPITNYSSEGSESGPPFFSLVFPLFPPDMNFPPPDFPNGGNPPASDTAYTAVGCMTPCVSYISQNDADLCAMRQAVICTNPNGALFPSEQQSCTVACPDGTQFTYIIGPGALLGVTQSEANTEAYRYACAKAHANRVCLSSINGKQCQDATFAEVITASGGTAPFTWSIISGSLPPGITLGFSTTSSVVIGGIGTTIGSYTFMLRCTDAHGNYMQKAFTIQIVGIVNDILPNGAVGMTYNEQLTTSGLGTNPEFTLLSGNLPDGLALTSDGFIQGDATVADDFFFTVHGSNPSTGEGCQKDFMLTVEVVGTALNYWQCDDPDGTGTLYDSMGDQANSLFWASKPTLSRPGKIGTAIRVGIIVPPDGIFDFRTYRTSANNKYDFQGVDFTVRFWAYISSDNLGGYGDIFRQATQWRIYYAAYNDNELTLKFSGADLAEYQATASIGFDAWHRVVAWHQRNVEIGIQIDNNAPVITPCPTVVAPPGFTPYLQLWHITNRPGWDCDEIGIWKRKLSAAELLSDWNGGVGKTYPNIP